MARMASKRIAVDTLLRWAIRVAIEDRERFLQGSEGLRGPVIEAERATAALQVTMFTKRTRSLAKVAAVGEVTRIACDIAVSATDEMLAHALFVEGATASAALNEKFTHVVQLKALIVKSWGMTKICRGTGQSTDRSGRWNVFYKKAGTRYAGTDPTQANQRLVDARQHGEGGSKYAVGKSSALRYVQRLFGCGRRCRLRPMVASGTASVKF